MLLGTHPVLGVTYIQGFDVYSLDGAVNWTTAKNAGYAFAFVKCDEGSEDTDSRFAANMSGANAAGVYVGPYHFAHTESLSPAGTVKFDNYTGGAFSPTSPTQVNRDAYADATIEAVDFIKLIKPYYYQTGTTHYLPPVSDIEQAFMPNLSQSLKTQFVSNWAQLFSDTVYNAIGVRPILYVSKSSANTNFTSTVAAEQPFWIAQYKGTGTTSPPVVSDTPGWPAWSFWQWSDGTDTIAKGSLVPGTSGSVDRDVFSGSSAQLAAMAVQLLPGDYNHDGVVDMDDYLVWRNSVGSTVLLAADGNNDGVVNATDYTYWRQRFGQTLGSGTSSGQLTQNAVPEPTAVSFLLLVIVVAVAVRCR
ncbi:MAG TPA: GH25 family lysozyme [Lacipirellulaceae bacterium]|nr:GH25 family lysozyme [Lacipirellulaceae bacterium]